MGVEDIMSSSEEDSSGSNPREMNDIIKVKHTKKSNLQIKVKIRYHRRRAGQNCNCSLPVKYDFKNDRILPKKNQEKKRMFAKVSLVFREIHPRNIFS